MAANTTTLNAVTKEVYEGRLNEQLENSAVALKRIEKTSEGTGQNIGGRYVVFPIHTKRNSGLGARRENELLPTAGQQGTASAQVGLKYLYGQVELTGQVLELIDKDFQAFISALDLEMNGLKDDLTKDLNRQVHGNGNGTIGVVKSVVTSNTIPVDRADLFQEDEIVDIVTLPFTVAVVGRKVTAIDLTAGANTVTIDGAAVTTIVGQIITRTGNGPVSATLNREWTGLNAIVNDTGVLYNIYPAATSVWKSNIMRNGGVNRALSENLMTTMADTIRTKGGTTTAIFTTLGVRRAYATLLQNQRRYNNVKDFTGGFSGIGFVTDNGEIPVVVDVDARPNAMTFLNEGEMKLYRANGWEFMDRDGSKWQRKVGYDAYQSTMYQYSEIGTHRRNTHGRIDDITEG